MAPAMKAEEARATGCTRRHFLPVLSCRAAARWHHLGHHAPGCVAMRLEYHDPAAAPGLLIAAHCRSCRCAQRQGFS
jgi:hypothetical protein